MSVEGCLGSETPPVGHLHPCWELQGQGVDLAHSVPPGALLVATMLCLSLGIL